MITLSNVTKRYGRTTAIDNVTSEISQNGIYSLLGRNGAGKTTLMKLVAGHLGATDGVVSVNGRESSPQRMPDDVSFVESHASQFNLRVREMLEAARLLRGGFDDSFAQRMLDEFELDERARYKKLSFGMQTMVTTIAGLAGSAEVVMLDEPALGLDAIMRERFNTLLDESAQRHPRIIIVSTHLIDEIAKVAGHLIVMDRGQILFNATMDEIDESFHAVTGDPASLNDFFVHLVKGHDHD